MKKSTRYEMRHTRYENGSALILAVVLTSLLAIVGLVFVMVSRVEKVSTSAISENKELNLAVETIIAQISQELVWDTPGVAGPNEEYYDYPDIRNAWLASLEPYYVAVHDYWWQQISDVYGVLGGGPNTPAEVVSPSDDAILYEIADADGDGISDSRWVAVPGITSNRGRPIYAAIRVVDNGGMLNVNTGFKFDPVMDSNWIDGSSQMQINLMALASQPGEDPPTPDHETDLLEARANYGFGGVNPADLGRYEEDVVWRYNEPNGPYTPFDISDELELRYRFLVNHGAIDTRLEELGPRGGKWGYREYAFRTPVINPGDLDEWFLSACGTAGLDPNYAYRHIATTYNMDRIINQRPFLYNDEYLVNRMVNVNIADRDLLYAAIREGLWDAGVTDDGMAAQIAANLRDYTDMDSDISALDVDGDGSADYYGFERPCVYISELAYEQDPCDPSHTVYGVELHKPYPEDENPLGWQLMIDRDGNGVADVNQIIDWSGTNRFHVIKSETGNLLSVVFNEPNGPDPPDGATVDPNVVLTWPVVADACWYDVYLGTNDEAVRDANSTDHPNVDYNSVVGSVTSLDPNGSKPLSLDMYYWRVDALDKSGAVIRVGEIWSFTVAESGFTDYQVFGMSAGEAIFDNLSIIELWRPVPAAPYGYVVVDSVRVPDRFIMRGRLPVPQPRSLKRDIRLHKCMSRKWDDDLFGNTWDVLTLGHSNEFEDPSSSTIQAHPADAGFTNIGEIGMVFRGNAYIPSRGADLVQQAYPPDIMGYNDEKEEDVRVNLAVPVFQQIFNYLTVFDPAYHGHDPNETRIKGRININTAPWYVIAQLPWVSQREYGYSSGALADAIVAYRDRRGIYSNRPGIGFRSIGELNNVVEDADPNFCIDFYARVAGDQVGFPDLSAMHPVRAFEPGDGAPDDFEERDLIFARISNLVTVRSDVFTAYILVRLGADGPQKRVMAILDRSDVYPNGRGGVTGRVRVRALHPVPDPR